MDKLKFILGTIVLMVVFYIFLTILMPLFVTVTGNAVTDVQASPNVDAYGLSVAGLQYFNLFIYFVPAAIAVTVIYLKLKEKI